MAEFISLYSGSSGNSSVVRCGAQYLIVDMGKGVRTTTAALKSLMASPSDLSAAVVVRTPLPISTMRYCVPQRTTLLLPEEPEYNEMNSAMKTSYVTT